ncbi:MAG: hypothetical protein R2875_17340 [Desulfobacterales bacterium]
MYAGKIVADASPAEMKQALQGGCGASSGCLNRSAPSSLKRTETAGFDGVALFSRRITFVRIRQLRRKKYGGFEEGRS